MKIFLVLITLALLSSQVLRLVPESKYIFLIKPALVCAILLTVFSVGINFDLKNRIDLSDANNNQNEVWDNAVDSTEEIFKQQILNLCKNNGLTIEKITVDLKTDYKSFDIQRILVEGPDKSAAKSLIISTYRLNEDLVK